MTDADDTVDTVDIFMVQLDLLNALLLEETTLLDALDLQEAGRLASRKHAAVLALQQSLISSEVMATLDTERSALVRDGIHRMSELAESNRTAIERGLALQTQLIQAIARAMPRARAVEAPVYQPDGSKVPNRPPEAYTFLSQM